MLKKICKHHGKLKAKDIALNAHGYPLCKICRNNSVRNAYLKRNFTDEKIIERLSKFLNLNKKYITPIIIKAYRKKFTDKKYA